MATLQQRVRFPAAPRVLYDLYTDAQAHSAAVGAKVTFEGRPGGRFSAWDGFARGKVLDLAPGKRIVTTWRASDWKASDPDSVLVLTFAAVAGGCELRMVHANVPDREAAALRAGWREYYWTPFRAAVKAR